MPAQLITTDDLRQFKSEMLDEIKNLLSDTSQDPKAERWLRSSDVEKLLNISANKLYQLRVTGGIPHYRFGSTIYYKYQDIVDCMQPVK